MHLSSLLRFIWQRVQITSNSKKRMFWCHWQCWSQRGIVYICICFCICTMYIEILIHSSEKTGLRSTFWPRETLQNLLCLWKKKTQAVFFVFHLEQLWVLPLWMRWSMSTNFSQLVPECRTLDSEYIFYFCNKCVVVSSTMRILLRLTTIKLLHRSIFQS